MNKYLLALLLVAGSLQAQPVTMSITAGPPITLHFDRAITATVQVSQSVTNWVTLASWDVAEADALAVGRFSIGGVECRELYYRCVPAGTVAPPLAEPLALTLSGGHYPSRLTEGVSGTLELTFSWDPSPDENVTGYALYQGTEPGVWPLRIPVGAALTTKVPVPFLPATYYWVAVAYTIEGLESLPSNEVNYEVLSAQP